MKAFEIKVEKKIKLLEEDINDILCSCFEGGCGYWACLDNTTQEWDMAHEALHEQYENDNFTIEDVMTWILYNGYSIHLIDKEEDREYSFNMEGFLDGVSKSISAGFWTGEDTCDVDGIVGDAIIQYTVFGEQVYC
jgi:hypothetical protein